MTQKRRQLTLFIDPAISTTIEHIRKTYNPEQFALINSHVTLCREDEIEPIEDVIRNLKNLRHAPVHIHFGAVTRFSEGKGVLLLAVGPNTDFHQLRAAILSGIIDAPRMHEPHITLMHPRNSTCTDTIFQDINNHVFPTAIPFHIISLIEQEMGQPWQILDTFVGISD